jgi:hypothetical protein
MSQALIEVNPPVFLPARASPNYSGAVQAVGERRATASLKVFWALCVITMVMSHYAIAARLNIPYKAITVLVVLAAPLTTGFASLFSKKAVLWLLVYEAVLIIGCLISYTGNPSDLYNVHSAPVVMIRVFPFMLCGYTLAQFARNEKKWLLGLLVMFALVTLPDAIIFARGSLQGLQRDRLLTSNFDFEAANAILSGYLNLTVCCLILAVIANRLRDLVSRGLKWLITLCQLTLASVCMTAGFTAAALLLFLSILLLGLLAPVRTLRFRVVTMALGFAAVTLAWVALGALAGGTGGTVRQIYSRLEGLRTTVVTGEVTKATSKATSGRLDLGLISIRSFLNSPLIGMGKGKESQTIAGHNSDTIGGHSYILDSLGQRGLLGTFPVLAALGSLLLTAYRNFRRSPGSWRGSAMLAVMPMWIVAMIINPYFLGYLALNCVIFFSFGLILGDSDRLNSALGSLRFAGTGVR